jgi:F-type H+-transporting ATPase subunit b
MFITQAIAATAAQPGAAAAAKAPFPPFDVSTFAGQVFWLAITFGALYFIMSRVALPRVEKILEVRRLRIEGDLEAAAAAQKSAEAAVAHYEKTLADAKAAVQKNVQELRERLAGEADTRRKALESELNARIAAAEEKIAASKAQAMSNVSAIAAEAAGAIVRQITGREADSKAVAQAVADVKA